jgi:hypothetical protein
MKNEISHNTVAPLVKYFDRLMSFNSMTSDNPGVLNDRNAWLKYRVALD